MIDATQAQVGGSLWVPTVYGPLQVKVEKTQWVVQQEMRTKLFIQTAGNDWIGQDRLFLSREEAEPASRQLAREHAALLRRHVEDDVAEIARLDAYADGP
jgi:hypothetical protein